MRYRLISIFLWLYVMSQHELRWDIVVVMAIAFVLMSYRWILLFPILTLLSVTALFYTDGMFYYGAMFVAVMSMIIATFTVPHGSGPGYGGAVDYAGGATFDSGGDSGGDAGGGC